MNSVTIFHKAFMEDSRETLEGVADTELSTCANFASPLTSGEVWVVLFSFMQNSSYCCVDISMAARSSMASLGFFFEKTTSTKGVDQFLHSSSHS